MVHKRFFIATFISENETVSGIIGNTQGVNIAANPAIPLQ